eukprot:2599988-Pleurochrysis_carterae.AAC.1
MTPYSIHTTFQVRRFTSISLNEELHVELRDCSIRIPVVAFYSCTHTHPCDGSVHAHSLAQGSTDVRAQASVYAYASMPLAKPSHASTAKHSTANSRGGRERANIEFTCSRCQRSEARPFC